ncbi:MAG: DUF5654 family protein [Candidatus Paceibacterota bacterium]
MEKNGKKEAQKAGVIRTAISFKTEFKKHMVTAITAAFALIIALAWQDAIKEWISFFVARLGILPQSIYLYKIYVAVAVTLVCVVAIILFSRWGAKQEKQ